MIKLNIAQRGVGLVEVLIALVVVSVGILALSALQANLMTSSGETKARSEATAIAEQKIESLRSNIEDADFDAIVSSLAPETIQGINNEYSLTWTVTDQNDPVTKLLTVTVDWPGNDFPLSLSTEIAWVDPQKSVDYASSGAGVNALAPSPNNQSSFETDLVFTDENGDPISGTPLNDGTGLATHQPDGDSDLYLIDPTTGQAILRFTGGIIHTIKGTVYVETGNAVIPSAVYPVAFSDLGYCMFPLPETDADYVCYFGGDCSQGGEGCSGAYRDIQGGWYGKVGLLETPSADFQNKKVCFGEDLDSPAGAVTVNTTARSYATRRINLANNAITSEGMNQSFSCQNFLVVDKAGNSYPCGELARDPDNPINVPSSAIERVLGYNGETEVANQSLAEDTSQCGSPTPLVKYMVTGNITGPFAEEVTVTLGGQVCTISIGDNEAYSYQCAVYSSTGAPDLMAYNGSVSPALVEDVADGSVQDFSTGNVSYPETDYVITGELAGDEAANVEVFVETNACNLDLVNLTYTCNYTTTSPTIELTAIHNDGGAVSPNYFVLDVVGTAEVDGPTFSGSEIVVATTYTISGALIGSNLNKVSVSISDNGICTINKAGNNYSYECTVTTPNSQVTLTASTTQSGNTITPAQIIVNNLDPNSPIISEAGIFSSQ